MNASPPSLVDPIERQARELLCSIPTHWQPLNTSEWSESRETAFTILAHRGLVERWVRIEVTNTDLAKGYRVELHVSGPVTQENLRQAAVRHAPSLWRDLVTEGGWFAENIMHTKARLTARGEAIRQIEPSRCPPISFLPDGPTRITLVRQGTIVLGEASQGPSTIAAAAAQATVGDVIVNNYVTVPAPAVEVRVDAYQTPAAERPTTPAQATDPESGPNRQQAPDDDPHDAVIPEKGENTPPKDGPGDGRQFYWGGVCHELEIEQKPLALLKYLWDRLDGQDEVKVPVADIARAVWHVRSLSYDAMKSAVSRMATALVGCEIPLSVAKVRGENALTFGKPTT